MTSNEKKPDFDRQEIIAAIKKFDFKMQKEIKMPFFARQKLNAIEYLGCMLLHFVADKKMKEELIEINRTIKKSTKVAAALENKKFEYEKYGAHFCHKVVLRHGKILNSYQWLKEINTSNGKAYFQINCDADNVLITVFTSHFFDRFAMRTGMASSISEAVKMREEAIYEYMRSNLSVNDDKIEHDGEIAIGTEKGLCLGIKRDNIVMIKTFISNEMLKGNQPILAEETCLPIFEKFEHMLNKKENYDIDKFGTVFKKVDINRNDPCTCGSGKKFKKCCI